MAKSPSNRLLAGSLVTALRIPRILRHIRFWLVRGFSPNFNGSAGFAASRVSVSAQEAGPTKGKTREGQKPAEACKGQKPARGRTHKEQDPCRAEPATGTTCEEQSPRRAGTAKGKTRNGAEPGKGRTRKRQNPRWGIETALGQNPRRAEPVQGRTRARKGAEPAKGGTRKGQNPPWGRTRTGQNPRNRKGTGQNP